MTENYIVLEGKDLNQLIQMGLEKLNKTEDEVEINVLSRGKSIAGLNIKKHKIEIIVIDNTAKESAETQSTTEEVESNNKSVDTEVTEYNQYDIVKKFEILYKEDGVYLSINPQSVININIKDILQKIKRKNIQEVDYSKIEEIVDSEQEVCIKIAPEQEEVMIDSIVDIEISKDKMSAYMTIYPADGGKEYTAEEIIEKLSQEISFGIDKDAVKNYVEKGKYEVSELVARGKEAIDGKDGYIEYKFQSEKENSPYIQEDGSVDFRKLNLITNVRSGDVLAELYLPEEGSDGKNVLGEEILHKPGASKTFNYGVNVKLSENQMQLISEIDGQTCVENGKIIVYELYTVSKDVDNSTGDIEFNGNIKINGSVLTGFKVIAKGNIEIEGVVEGSTIKCGGDLLIKRGVQGYNVAKIESKGKIITKFIENAKINSGGDIESEAIMHSDTVCSGSIMVGGKKGLLVGGTCKAEGEINAKVIGSHMATATLLEVGIDPIVRENHEKLKEMKKNIKDDIDKFSKMINHLNKIGKGDLSPDKLDMLNKSMMAKAQLEEKKVSLDKEIKCIEEKIKDASKGTINVAETIYSGVKVIIGNSTMLFQENRDHCTIYRDEGEIKVGPYLK